MSMPIIRSWVRTLLLVYSLGLITVTQAGTNIALTKHNLTPTGPGTIKTSESTGLCVFCHTPHNANPTIGLWNRDLSAQTYTLYSSSTLNGVVNQPTGSSRLCLSCHDGTVALDRLRAPPKAGPLFMNVLTGSTVLGTDLSGSHPISFTYDTALATKNLELIDPHSIPKNLRLEAKNPGDPNSPLDQLECASCHDPHEDKQPNFLRMDNRAGALCTSCHNLKDWLNSAHANSTATWNNTGTNPWPTGAYATVADNACQNCHRSHAAAHPQRLLAQTNESDNCTLCHNGNVAAKNVASEFNKYSSHPIQSTPWTHDPNEDPQTMARHVSCTDCHNPHSATSTASLLPAAPGVLRDVKSVNMGGSVIPDPNYEYEVCNKCHGLHEPTTQGIQRQSATRNIRTKIQPTNLSFHPIAAPGRNLSIQGLKPPLTASSQISCISCHNNDSWTPTGISPKGSHGSNFAPILAAQDSTNDNTAESPQTYALCYQCHDETTLLNPVATTGFPHYSHVVTDQAPCAACHDAHGSSQNAHLIDFMLRDLASAVVVSPSGTGLLQYTSLGTDHGQCSLSCHGHNHNASKY